MKRFRFIFLGALVILMAGCSKNNPQTPPDEDAWMYDLSLPVPVRFGSGLPLTKAEVNSLEGLEISIWGFDKNTDLSAPAEGAVLLNNAKVTVSGGKIETGKYYPRKSTYNYAFYACYPSKSSPTVEGGAITVNANLDGQEDILWACAVTGGDGYNAEYIRNTSDQPALKFEHVLAAINFKAVGNQNTAGTHTDKDFESVYVKKVTVKNVPSGGRLDLMTGEIAVSAYNEEVTIFGGKVNPTLEGTLLGGQYLLYPDPATGGKITIVVEASYPGEDSVEMEWTSPMLASGGKYTFNIGFNKAQEVNIEIVDPEWSEEDQSIDFDDETLKDPEPVKP